MKLEIPKHFKSMKTMEKIRGKLISLLKMKESLINVQ
jgi:hypothetical protein